MPDRYFSASPIEGATCLLSGPEAHHLIHVMRAKRGTRLVLFDGTGAEFAAEVAEVRRSEARLAILSRQEVDRELPLELTLGVALPKGDRQKWLVEKAVELGVTRLVPLRTARSVTQPADQALARLGRSVIEASKQCGRNRLMEIGGPAGWTEFIASSPETAQRLLAHPPRDIQRGDDRLRLGNRHGAACVAIGPEGGFTEEEVELALSRGWQAVHLGPRILRVETAAVLLVARVAAAWQG